MPASRATPAQLLLRELKKSEHKKVVLWYGTSFLVAGGTYIAQRNTVERLARLGRLERVEGIKETYAYREPISSRLKSWRNKDEQASSAVDVDVPALEGAFGGNK